MDVRLPLPDNSPLLVAFVDDDEVGRLVSALSALQQMDEAAGLEEQTKEVLQSLLVLIDLPDIQVSINSPYQSQMREHRLFSVLLPYLENALNGVNFQLDLLVHVVKLIRFTSRNDENRLALFECGCVAPIISMMSHKNADVRSQALLASANFTLCSKLQSALIDECILPRLYNILLHEPTLSLKETAASALFTLIYSSKSLLYQRKFCETGGIQVVSIVLNNCMEIILSLTKGSTPGPTFSSDERNNVLRILRLCFCVINAFSTNNRLYGFSYGFGDGTKIVSTNVPNIDEVWKSYNESQQVEYVDQYFINSIVECKTVETLLHLLNAVAKANNHCNQDGLHALDDEFDDTITIEVYDLLSNILYASPICESLLASRIIKSVIDHTDVFYLSTIDYAMWSVVLVHHRAKVKYEAKDIRSENDETNFLRIVVGVSRLLCMLLNSIDYTNQILPSMMMQRRVSPDSDQTASVMDLVVKYSHPNEMIRFQSTFVIRNYCNLWQRLLENYMPDFNFDSSPLYTPQEFRAHLMDTNDANKLSMFHTQFHQNHGIRVLTMALLLKNCKNASDLSESIRAAFGFAREMPMFMSIGGLMYAAMFDTQCRVSFWKELKIFADDEGNNTELIVQMFASLFDLHQWIRQDSNPEIDEQIAQRRRWIFGQCLAGFLYYMTDIQEAIYDAEDGGALADKPAIVTLKIVIGISKSVRYSRPYLYALSKLYVNLLTLSYDIGSVIDIEAASLTEDINELTNGEYGESVSVLKMKGEGYDEELTLAIQMAMESLSGSATGNHKYNEGSDKSVMNNEDDDEEIALAIQMAMESLDGSVTGKGTD